MERQWNPITEVGAYGSYFAKKTVAQSCQAIETSGTRKRRRTATETLQAEAESVGRDNAADATEKVRHYLLQNFGLGILDYRFVNGLLSRKDRRVQTMGSELPLYASGTSSCGGKSHLDISSALMGLVAPEPTSPKSEISLL